METETSGSIVDIGSGKNKITNITIYDASGNDVTKYYEISKVDGELTIF